MELSSHLRARMGPLVDVGSVAPRLFLRLGTFQLVVFLGQSYVDCKLFQKFLVILILTKLDLIQ